MAHHVILKEWPSGVYIEKTSHRVHGIRYEVCKPCGCAGVVEATFALLKDAVKEAQRLDAERT